MTLKVQCDRCGTQEQVPSVMVLSGTMGPGIPKAESEIPDGWSRPLLPTGDGELRGRDLCPPCLAGLLEFMAPGDEPDYRPRRVQVAEALARADGVEWGPGKDSLPLAVHQKYERMADAALGAEDVPAATEATQICRDCGHLVHDEPCPDYVSEVGACGCEAVTR